MSTNLVSPGVSVTVTDQSFYIPAAAVTVPLIFIATKANKLLPDGTTTTGTTEHNVIETVTSLTQSNQLYGTPNFMIDSAGNQLHGDARNEYGVFALNQFLSVGNRAFVVRANVDLDDSEINVLAAWNSQIAVAKHALSILANAWITDFNNINGYVADNPLFKTTINEVEFMSLADEAMQAVYSQYAFRTVKYTFESDLSAAPLSVYENGFNFAPTGQFIGLAGSVNAIITAQNNALISAWTAPSNYAVTFALATTQMLQSAWFAAGNTSATFSSATTAQLLAAWTGFGNISATLSLSTIAQQETAWVAAGGSNTLANFHPLVVEWTPTEAAAILLLVARTYEYTVDFVTRTSLGANDAARRIAIVAALQSIIVSNEDIKSELYEYNLIVCPGYPEVVTDLAHLSVSINEEAFIIADTPMQSLPELGAWAGNGQVRDWNVAYYYPPAAIATNLDGVDVACAVSGVALAAYTYSDSVSYVWFAPAGETRGLISASAGVKSIGYIQGNAGTATKFIDTHLNQGQRDALYNVNHVNPIINTPGTGLILFGQHVSNPGTAGSAGSARDRVNVERTICYIKRQIRKSLIVFLFEPNDSITRQNVKSVVDGFLNGIMAKRGLQDFATVCDATNNDAEKVNNNELWIDIALQPQHTVEFLHVPIRILTAGASLTK